MVGNTGSTMLPTQQSHQADHTLVTIVNNATLLKVPATIDDQDIMMFTYEFTYTMYPNQSYRQHYRLFLQSHMVFGDQCTCGSRTLTPRHGWWEVECDNVIQGAFNFNFPKNPEVLWFQVKRTGLLKWDGVDAKHREISMILVKKSYCLMGSALWTEVQLPIFVQQ